MTNDIDELTALNLDFVASAQNSDVRRFDEIVAPEFYCSNPDKSLVDRAAFLEQTAKPVAIKNLQAHDAKICIMGHFAIIHAATSYTTPDGQQAGNYYVMDPDGGNREVLLKGEAPIEGGRPTWKPK